MRREGHALAGMLLERVLAEVKWHLIMVRGEKIFTARDNVHSCDEDKEWLRQTGFSYGRSHGDSLYCMPSLGVDRQELDRATYWGFNRC